MSLIRLGHVWRDTWYDLVLYPAEEERGIGFDINCGMRLVVMNLTYAEVKGVTLHRLQVV
jgi:hypothetical protein